MMIDKGKLEGWITAWKYDRRPLICRELAAMLEEVFVETAIDNPSLHVRELSAEDTNGDVVFLPPTDEGEIKGSD